MNISSLSGPKLLWVNILFFFLSAGYGFGQVVINEIVSSNSGGITDEDGESSDWIELYNSGSEAVNLAGYGISDNAEDPFKWEMPEDILEPGSYYLIFASDKDREGYSAFWETIIRESDETKYIVPTSIVSNSWVQADFNDESWESGPFGIGYGDGDDATEIPSGTISVFTRTSFTISDPEDISRMMLHIDFDDGYVAYLNGEEISRQNIEGTAPLAYNASSSTFIEPILVKGGELDPISLDNFKSLLKPGENVLAIQLHNFGTGSSDLSLIPFLSLAYNNAPEISRGVAPEISIDANEVAYPHTNFKISSSGENVFLTNPDGTVVQQVSVPKLIAGESYGRNAEAENSWGILTSPSPMGENTGEFYQARTAAPSLSQSGGFYPSSIDVALGSDLGGDVYYTTNGAIPTTSSRVLLSSISLRETTTVRVRAMEQDKLPSEVVTETFIIGRTHDLPVVSVATEPDNLWSDESGIYVQGTNGISGNCSNGPANWNQDWEIPINIELFEEGGSMAFNSGAGAKIFGGCSRTNPEKSLSIFFRGEYGNSELNYKLFEEKDIDKFQAFVLRNSGNDFSTQGHSMFRDGMMTTLIEDTGIEYQAFRPAVVYLNGEYWGIHNIREKVNEHFIESNSNADSENIDLLENNGNAIHGTRANYSEFLSDLESANMQNEDEYREVESMIDMDNYIDYMAAQIYYANTDWPGNNIKFWRDRSSNSGWRWILYDTDFGFDLRYNGVNDYSGQMYRYNMFDFVLTTESKGWANQEWSTFILRRFVESDVFVQKFVNRMADLMNTVFHPEYVNYVIDSLSQKIESEIPNHVERWGNSVGAWEGEIERIRNFADGRPEMMKTHLKQEFGLSNPVSITLNVSGREKGSIKVNRIVPDEYPWTGEYFSELSVKMTAIPMPGYRFTGWSGSSSSVQRTILIDPADQPNLTANFEAYSSANIDIVINEIMYNAEENNDPEDWVELYNKSSSGINVGNWVLKDEDDTHEFIIPANTVIDGGEYLVISQNRSEFTSVYSDLDLGETLIGDMGFGLGGGGDQVRIFDSSGNLVDQVEYDDTAPWAEEADGAGYTLELNDADSDNTLPENWLASANIGGSPGSENQVVVSNEPKDALPKAVSLAQNYPNPFNPVTTITFELSESANVRLSIFDLLGREVAVLRQGALRAGMHTTKWDAANFSSGVYMYRLEVNGEKYIKKMLLTK
jgi:hypothetical protein